MTESVTSTAVLPAPQEGISFSPRFIVEVGPGRNPLPFIEDGIVRKGDRYLGVESLAMRWPANGGETFSDVVERMAALSDTEGEYSIVRGDGQSLPVKDGEVDEVFMGNVLGYVDLSSSDARLLISEAIRVLKEDGKFTVLETMTPVNLRHLEDILASKGFKLKNVGKTKDQDLAKKYSRYGLALSEYSTPNRQAYLAQFGFNDSTIPMNLR